jgi:hypothetical protein
MTLAPTDVTINGLRVWLEDRPGLNLEAALATVKYRADNGLGLHIQSDPKLPKRARIVSEEPAPAKEQDHER